MSKEDTKRFKRGARLFQKVQPRLLRRHKGQIVALEPDSGRYFIGKDELAATHLALDSMPGKIFDFFRVGYPVVHKFRPLRSRDSGIC